MSYLISTNHHGNDKLSPDPVEEPPVKDDNSCVERSTTANEQLQEVKPADFESPKDTFISQNVGPDNMIDETLDMCVSVAQKAFLVKVEKAMEKEEEEDTTKEAEQDYIDKAFQRSDEIHSPPFPGMPRAVPHRPEDCASSDHCIHKLGPRKSQDSYNLNESRADDSTESESESKTAEQPFVVEDPRNCVPRLDLENLASFQPESGGSSARSDISLEYLKTMFGSPPPYHPFFNPYYPYMSPFHPAFMSPRHMDSTSRQDGIVRPTAQFPYNTHSFPGLPHFQPHHPTLSPHRIIPRSPRPKRKAAPVNKELPNSKHPKKSSEKVIVQKRPRLVSCNSLGKGSGSCSETFHTTQQLVCHIANIHKREGEHACMVCAKFSTEKLQMWRRKIEHEKMRSVFEPSLASVNNIEVIMLDK